MDTPSLKSIYDGTTTAPCASDDLQLVELFKNFNDIAHAGLFAHPTKLSFKANSLVFLYGLDVGHCFLISINQARYNLILIVFIWAATVLGKSEMVEGYKSSYDLRMSYMRAGLEMLDSGGCFDHRNSNSNSDISLDRCPDIPTSNSCIKGRAITVHRDLSSTHRTIRLQFTNSNHHTQAKHTSLQALAHRIMCQCRQ
jgi:hypothetical protein